MEHVLPQEFSNDYWMIRFSQEQHEKYKNNIGNILPISRSMNAQIKNSGYDKKRSYFERDSVFKLTRETAKKYQDWDLDVIKDRSEEIAKWALKEWRVSRDVYIMH